MAHGSLMMHRNVSCSHCSFSTEIQRKIAQSGCNGARIVVESEGSSPSQESYKSEWSCSDSYGGCV